MTVLKFFDLKEKIMSFDFTVECCDHSFLRTHFNHFAAMHHRIWHNTYGTIENLPEAFITANPIEYFTQHWQDIVNDPNAHVLWAHDDQSFLGFSVLSSAPYENEEKISMSGLSDSGHTIGALDHIFILQNEQHGGVGRTLFTHAVNTLHTQGATQMIIDVYNGNENALGFYRHMGCTMGERYNDVETRDGEAYLTPSIMIGVPSLQDFLATQESHCVLQRSTEAGRRICQRPQNRQGMCYAL